MLAEGTRKPEKEPGEEAGSPDPESEDQLHIQNFCSLFRDILVSSATTVDMTGIFVIILFRTYNQTYKNNSLFRHMNLI